MSTVLVLGGARSGKSTWAEARFDGVPEVTYVATSAPDAADPEWAARVELHRRRRPPTWRTVETLDLADVLRADDNSPVLIDCLTLWLTRVLDDVGAWDDAVGWRTSLDGRVSQLLAALAETGRDAVLVSNEVGSGIVPETASGRLFRDELGRLNAAVAAACDEAWLCVAGLPLRLK